MRCRVQTGLPALVLLTLASFPVASVAVAAPDNSDVETRVKAAFIYNFARFIEWPARSGAGPLRIGIMGHGDLTSALQETIRGKTIGGRAIALIPVGAAADADTCEILLIERSESRHQNEIAQALAGKPVLTVSDDENGLREGIMIAFQLTDESVRFQINQEAAAHAGLKISSQLLKVALPSQGRRQ